MQNQPDPQVAEALSGFKELLERNLEKLGEFQAFTVKEFEHIRRRFDKNDATFDIIGLKLLEHDKRFDAHDKRFDAHDKRFDDHDSRFDAHDKRFDDHDRRFDTLDRRMHRLETRIEALEPQNR